NPLVATDAHVALVAHVTLEELKKMFDAVSMVNGVANRVLWLLTRRSKELPFGAEEPDLAPLAERFKRAVIASGRRSEMKLDGPARGIWAGTYSKLSTGSAVTSRGPVQSLRIAMIYALLDGAKEIRQEHLAAGLALWDFCRESAEIVFCAEAQA